MTETVSNQPSLWIRHKKIGLWLLGSAVLAGSIVWLGWFLTRPVSGIIHTPSLDTPESDVKRLEKRLYEGNNFSFSYSGNYEEKSHQTALQGPVLESLLLATAALDGRKIAVTIANRGVPDLMSDPSYQVRVSDRYRYQSSAFVISNYEGVIFEKTEAPFEKTAFFTTRGLIVSVALTSLFRADGMKEELEEILSDFDIILK